MRKITLLLLLISSMHLYSQWNDSFNDANLTQNPTWSGNTDLFVINSAQQLQLNAAVAGNAYLSTPQKLRKGTTWEFWVKMNFNPSQYNYTRIYLASNNADPMASTTGYYVSIGGLSDKVNLTKKTAATSTTEIIAGETGQLNLAMVSVSVKVEFTHQSVWKLYVKMPTDGDFILKGEFQDNTPVVGDYFALQPIYTVSNIKNFYFDDISNKFEAEIDSVPPTMTNFTVNNSLSLSVSFSEPVSIANAAFTVNGLGEAITKTLSEDAKSVDLHFDSPFADGIYYSLSIAGVKDTTGNLLSTQSYPFTYWSTLQNAKAGDVVISEIMANPVGAAGLPEAEYVELHNNSGSRVNLEGWHFYYGDKGYSIPSYWLLPDSFVVIANPTAIAKMASSIPKIGVESFPVLANSGKLLYLQSPQNELISFAEYSDKWYGDDFKAKGGFSLECIDLKNVSGSSSNWKATTSKTGGTPGKQNSIKAENPDTEIPTIMQSSLVSADSVKLSFNRIMTKNDLMDITHFTISPSDFEVKTAIAATPLPNAVTLVLNKPISTGDQLTIVLKLIHSISGIPLQEASGVKIALSEMAETNDVVINEILFNPRPNGVDYVEIYNRSNRIVDLSKLYFTSKKADGTFQSGVRLSESSSPFFPKEYLVYTTDKSAILSNYHNANSVSIIELSSFPSMPDTEGNIQLVLPTAEIVDGFSYNEKMHHPFIKNTEGVSLERLSSERPTNDASNWQSASSDAGWGTPGLKNSQQMTENNEANDFWVENETITPDNNGQDDVLRIHYTLNQSGYTANIRIYTPNGQLVNSIATNALLGAEGVFTWTATDNTQKLVNPGIYLLFIEYYKYDKSAIRKKLPIVVGN
ncbi:MAG: lamin tail domain-containing protein [Bacteroidales bacterium]